MKFTLEKKLNAFCLNNELLSIWFSKTLQTSTITNQYGQTKKNVFVLNDPYYRDLTNTNKNGKKGGQSFFIRFPGTYEFSGIIINIYALHHNGTVKNVPQINLNKDLDITYIADPELFDINRHKNLLENIEETKILVLNFQNNSEKNLKIIKTLVDAIEPQFVIPYADAQYSDTQPSLDQYIIKLFGANPSKIDRLIIKPNLISQFKEKFILLQ